MQRFAELYEEPEVARAVTGPRVSRVGDERVVTMAARDSEGLQQFRFRIDATGRMLVARTLLTRRAI